MDELELKQQEVLKTMDVGYLPSLPEEKLRTATYQKYPLADLSALGTAFRPLVSGIQSVVSGGGAAGISKGAGKVISKIPVISRGPVDKALESAGEKLGARNAAKTDKTMHLLIETSVSCTAPFVQSIERISRIYNDPMNVFFDGENIYLMD